MLGSDSITLEKFMTGYRLVWLDANPLFKLGLGTYAIP